MNSKKNLALFFLMKLVPPKYQSCIISILAPPQMQIDFNSSKNILPAVMKFLFFALGITSLVSKASCQFDDLFPEYHWHYYSPQV